MKTIYKYLLTNHIRGGNNGKVSMPREAKVLSVQMVRGEAVIYALVDHRLPTVQRTFQVYGTGHPMPENPGRYLGTFQFLKGELVFHVFDPSQEKE